MWPPATGLMSKVVPPEGDTIDGKFVPGGTEICKNDWAMQRNKKVYGEDVAVFKPEGWLEAQGKQLETMEKTVGLIFGHGNYRCLGKNVALMELNKVFFEVGLSLPKRRVALTISLRNFDFTLIDPSNPWISMNYNLWMQKHMFIRVTDRLR